MVFFISFISFFVSFVTYGKIKLLDKKTLYFKIVTIDLAYPFFLT